MDNTFPQLRYMYSERSIEADKQQLREFADEKSYIAQNVFIEHPYLKARLHDDVSSASWGDIDRYIDTFSGEHTLEIEKAVTNYSNEWKNIEAAFWEMVKPLFSNYFAQSYVGYISIFSLQPILSAQSFQIAYFLPLRNAMVVTVHELLHFLFYPYVLSKWASLPHSWQDEERIRTLAEAFSGLMINHSPLKQLLGTADNYHDEVEEVVTSLLPSWPFQSSWGTQPGHDIDSFMRLTLHQPPFGTFSGDWGLRQMFVS